MGRMGGTPESELDSRLQVSPPRAAPNLTSAEVLRSAHASAKRCPLGSASRTAPQMPALAARLCKVALTRAPEPAAHAGRAQRTSRQILQDRARGVGCLCGCLEVHSALLYTAPKDDTNSNAQHDTDPSVGRHQLAAQAGELQREMSPSGRHSDSVGRARGGRTRARMAVGAGHDGP
ncbi:hypothetical protein B0H10DRAFT_2435998 [Mycena sp. CBHHK59/15]|nr:hypothetical protein B0H10DRAFT_2435998 [Mycena sp. CBHHK59/15]